MRRNFKACVDNMYKFFFKTGAIASKLNDNTRYLVIILKGPKSIKWKLDSIEENENGMKVTLNMKDILKRTILTAEASSKSKENYYQSLSYIMSTSFANMVACKYDLPVKTVKEALYIWRKKNNMVTQYEHKAKEEIEISESKMESPKKNNDNVQSTVRTEGKVITISIKIEV